MSASVESSAIFLKDQPNQIKNKINKYAFSGGQNTEEEQRKLGGDTDKDVAYQYLTFFLEDDEELEKIKVAYRTGGMLTGELKAKCIAELQTFVKGFQERRVNVTDEMITEFMTARPLEWNANPNPVRPEPATDGSTASAENESGKLTKNQEKKLAKLRQIEEKKAAAAAAKAKGN
jgi:tryptophanyl-tRNA synthetase